MSNAAFWRISLAIEYQTEIVVYSKNVGFVTAATHAYSHQADELKVPVGMPNLTMDG